MFPLLQRALGFHRMGMSRALLFVRFPTRRKHKMQRYRSADVKATLALFLVISCIVVFSIVVPVLNNQTNNRIGSSPATDEFRTLQDTVADILMVNNETLPEPTLIQEGTYLFYVGRGLPYPEIQSTYRIKEYTFFDKYVLSFIEYDIPASGVTFSAGVGDQFVGGIDFDPPIPRATFLGTRYQYDAGDRVYIPITQEIARIFNLACLYLDPPACSVPSTGPNPANTIELSNDPSSWFYFLAPSGDFDNQPYMGGGGIFKIPLALRGQVASAG